MAPCRHQPLDPTQEQREPFPRSRLAPPLGVERRRSHRIRERTEVTTPSKSWFIRTVSDLTQSWPAIREGHIHPTDPFEGPRSSLIRPLQLRQAYGECSAHPFTPSCPTTWVTAPLSTNVAWGIEAATRPTRSRS